MLAVNPYVTQDLTVKLVAALYTEFVAKGITK
jgi:hypothetical protein